VPRLRRPPANPTGEMTILEHIGELRSRLVKSCAALVVTTALAFTPPVYDRVIDFVTRSYCDLPARLRIATAAGDANCGLAALSPLEPLSIRVRVSLTVGLLLAMPFIAFQLWRFITPGLKPNEKRFAIPFALATTLLFAGGVAVAFFTLPKAIGFLASLGGSGIVTFFQADRYLRFVLFMGLAFGLSFEFPLVLVFLSMVGLLSSGAMLRAWRPAVAVIIVAAAIITPSQDPISLFAMAVPMWLFYFSAAALARYVIEPRRARRQRRLETQTG
jgi:sec-independent protein translocase protein TatC